MILSKLLSFDLQLKNNYLEFLYWFFRPFELDGNNGFVMEVTELFRFSFWFFNGVNELYRFSDILFNLEFEILKEETWFCVFKFAKQIEEARVILLSWGISTSTETRLLSVWAFLGL